MLIEFKVANFKSFREEQTFSLVASDSVKELPHCLIERDLPKLSGLRYLKGAAIYGANASGKSNFIEAVNFLVDLVVNSATKIQPGDAIRVKPFKLDKNSNTKPTRFEITFALENVRFVFGLSVTTERIIEEYLYAYPKGNPLRWYHRNFSEKNDNYQWEKPSSNFKQDKSLQDKTRINSLFISVGAQFNHIQLTQIFNWFKNKIYTIDFRSHELEWPELTLDLILNSKNKDIILNLLKNSDMGIVDARIKEKNKDNQYIEYNLTKSIKQNNYLDFEEIRPVELNLMHKTDSDIPIALEFNEESAGTRRFFALIGYWIHIINEGDIVFMDEIDKSFHPHLISELLKILFNYKTNQNNAQIIFTTHNPSLLDEMLLRRDQIWFTEKTVSGASYLYPLTDYKPREDESLAKGYLAGRYGAIPSMPEGLKL